MNYLFLRLLTLVKGFIGYVSSFFMGMFLFLSRVIERGAAKQVEKIKSLEEKTVARAKENVILAAKKVVELEQRVPEITQKAKDSAAKKIIKVQQKLK